MGKDKIENYEELKKYREGKEYLSKKDKIVPRVLTYGAGVLSVMGLTWLSFQTGPFAIVMVPLSSINSISIGLCAKEIVKYSDESKNKKAFKKLYPKVNMNISNKELNKILEYRDEEVLKNDIEKNKVDTDSFSKMSTEEKIKYLEEQKEFWKTVSLRDNIIEKPKQKSL